MIMNELQKRNYAVNGFLHISEFFDIDKIDKIFNDARKIFTNAMRGKIDFDGSLINDLDYFESKMFEFFKADTSTFISAGKNTQHSIELWRLASSNQIESLLKSLDLSFPSFSVRPSMFFNSKDLDNVGHYWKLGSHQDWRSSQGSLDSVTLWYPYVDCDVSLGALEVIPGSHVAGLLESSDVDYYAEIDGGQIDETDFVPVEMKKGDLLIFNSFLVHRSGTNTTNRIRWSSQLRYNNLDESTFIERGLPNPYIYQPKKRVTASWPSE